LDEGEEVTILGDPEEADGFTWVEIEFGNGDQGFTVTDNLSVEDTSE
jgi:uncharacterized protein YgiM (DUF1202 family)